MNVRGSNLGWEIFQNLQPDGKKFNSAVVQLTTRLVAFSSCAEAVCTAEDAMRKRVEALKEASTPKPPFALCYVQRSDNHDDVK